MMATTNLKGLARMIHDAAVVGSLAVQPFDILHEYASGLYGSECSSRVAAARVRNEPS
jgi:hypothetical protein